MPWALGQAPLLPTATVNLQIRRNLAYGHNHMLASDAATRRVDPCRRESWSTPACWSPHYSAPGEGAAGSRVLRHCLHRHCQPLIGAKLFLEGESVLARAELFGAAR